jgi:hypothetical protein
MISISDQEAYKSLKSKLEDRMWQNAYDIAWAGASDHPERIIYMISAYAGLFGYDHPAIKAMCDHLAFLLGHGLGPNDDILDQLLEEHDRIEYAKLAISQQDPYGIYRPKDKD